MRIGIIGAGHIGGTLTRRLSQLGHMVSVANSRGPQTLKDLADETGAKPVTVTEAARAGELVIVTIPMKSVSELPRNLFEGTFEGVVVVDTCNYYPRQRDGRIQAIEDGLPERLRRAADCASGGESVQQYFCPAPDGPGQAGGNSGANRVAGCR